MAQDQDTKHVQRRNEDWGIELVSTSHRLAGIMISLPVLCPERLEVNREANLSSAIHFGSPGFWQGETGKNDWVLQNKATCFGIRQRCYLLSVEFWKLNFRTSLLGYSKHEYRQYSQFARHGQKYEKLTGYVTGISNCKSNSYLRRLWMYLHTTNGKVWGKVQCKEEKEEEKKKTSKRTSTSHSSACLPYSMKSWTSLDLNPCSIERTWWEQHTPAEKVKSTQLQWWIHSGGWKGGGGTIIVSRTLPP